MISMHALLALADPALPSPGMAGATSLFWRMLADSLIVAACLAIPLGFIFFSWRRKDLQHRWILLVFGLFVLSFGITHLLSLLLLWQPLWSLHAATSLLTAGIAVGTALMVFRIIPPALRIPNPTQLASEVETEIKERREAYVALK